MGLWRREIKRRDGSIYRAWYGTVLLPTDERYKNGKPKYKLKSFVLGGCDQVGKKEAETAYHEARKILLKEATEEDSPQVSLSRFGDGEYLSYKRDILKNRSWNRDRYNLNNLYRILGAETILEDIKPNDLIAYQHKRLGEGVKPAAVNRELACLRSLVNLAKLKGKYTGDNQVSRISQLPEDNQVERILSPAEEKRLLGASPGYLRDILICALHTGMRQGEIFNLKWDNVDLKHNVISIVSSNSKSKRLRKIPINSVLRNTLLSLKSNNSYVFLSPHGRPYSGPGGTKHSFTTACKKAGISGLRFHDLRHTAATRMIEAGIDVILVSRILGHADLKTTSRYVHPSESLRQATEALVQTKT